VSAYKLFEYFRVHALYIFVYRAKAEFDKTGHLKDAADVD
jgi:hypothetical protein